MTDDEKMKEGTSSRGNEWEVVTLTQSAYDAADAEPGSKDAVSVDGNKDKEESGVNELQFNRSMFMSGHFVFPPSEHENLPLEPEVQPEDDAQHSSDHVAVGLEQNEEYLLTLKGLSESSELHQVESLEKGKEFFDDDTIIDETRILQSSNVMEKEHVVYSDPEFSSFYSGGEFPEYVADEDVIDDEESDDHSSEGKTDATSKPLEVKKPIKDIKKHRFPSETWWKRQAASLYAQAKEANAFWSICVAAALMGIVILGQRWQQERWQQLKLKMSSNDMKIQVLGPLNRFKDVFIGTSRRGLGGISSSDH